MRSRDRVACAILCVLAGCLLAAPVGRAAPVPKRPKPPRELTADVLEGRWRVDWGYFEGGWIEFTWNGCYRAKYRPDDDERHAGYWEVSPDGWTLTLHEWDGWLHEQRGCHRVEFSPDGWPALDGVSGAEFSAYPAARPMFMRVRLSERAKP